jgi:hypothetical protein
VRFIRARDRPWSGICLPGVGVGILKQILNTGIIKSLDSAEVGFANVLPYGCKKKFNKKYLFLRTNFPS